MSTIATFANWGPNIKVRLSLQSFPDPFGQGQVLLKTADSLALARDYIGPENSAEVETFPTLEAYFASIGPASAHYLWIRGDWYVWGPCLQALNIDPDDLALINFGGGNVALKVERALALVSDQTPLVENTPPQHVSQEVALLRKIRPVLSRVREKLLHLDIGSAAVDSLYQDVVDLEEELAGKYSPLE